MRCQLFVCLFGGFVFVWLVFCFLFCLVSFVEFWLVGWLGFCLCLLVCFWFCFLVFCVKW